MTPALRRFSILPLIGLAVVSAACSPPALESGFEDALSTQGGCGDAIFFAVDEADSMMLYLQVEGLLASAEAAGVEEVTEIGLPADGVQLVVELGEKVSDATCTDVLVNGGPQVRETYSAIAGSARITIRPADDAQTALATGDLLLEEVELESEGGDLVSMSSFEILGVTLGWFAG